MTTRPALADVVVRPSATIRQVMETIDRTGVRGAIVCDDGAELLGIAMDSDIRRAVLRNVDLGASVKTIMRTSVFALEARAPFAERHRLLLRSGKLFAPVIDRERRVLDYVTIDEVLRHATVAPGDDDNPPALPPARVLVIGGAGYIGSMLVDRLLRAGYRVRVLDLLLYDKAPIACFDGDRDRGALEFVRGDCRDEDTVRGAIDGVDAVVHLGEIVGDPACQINESFTIDTNYAATHLIVESCVKSRVRRFVFASSCSVYGQNDDEVDETSALHPVSLYARCKVESEKAILSFAGGPLCPTILRLATAHGRSHRQRLDLVVNYLTIKALAEGRIQIFGGTQWRPFIAVQDICRGITTVLQADAATVRGQVFNLGDSAENYQLRQIGELIGGLVDGAKVETLAEQGDPRNYRVSFAKVKRELDFSAERTVRDTVVELMCAYRDESLYRDYHHPRYSNLLALK